MKTSSMTDTFILLDFQLNVEIDVADVLVLAARDPELVFPGLRRVAQEGTRFRLQQIIAKASRRN
jgi:hypothetical protein